MLMNYNSNPYDVDAAKITFAEVYERWSAEKYPTVSESNVKGYKASYKCFEMLNDKLFKDIKLTELQYVVDNCGKNYPTLRKIKVFLSQIYAYAMKYEFCVKDYSKYVDIVKFKHQNPNSKDRNTFQQARNRLAVGAKQNRICSNCAYAHIQRREDIGAFGFEKGKCKP